MLLGKPGVRQINFSLHSFDGNERTRGKDEYIDDILTFSCRAALESNIITSLRLWNLDEGLITEDQRKRNIDVIHKIEEKFKLAYKIPAKLAEKKSLKISERIYLNQDYEFIWPDLQEEEDFQAGTCFGLRQHVAILVDGTVVPCCLDGEGVIDLGNIHECEFSRIINGDRAISIRDGFCKGILVEELCRKCGYRKRFNVKRG